MRLGALTARLRADLPGFVVFERQFLLTRLELSRASSLASIVRTNFRLTRSAEPNKRVSIIDRKTGTKSEIGFHA